MAECVAHEITLVTIDLQYLNGPQHCDERTLDLTCNTKREEQANRTPCWKVCTC